MKENSIKILIAGIGGVGGYFGSLLAKKYANHETIEIYFLARNQHLQAIKTNGIKVTSGEKEWIAHPTLASDNPAEFGKIDVILLCTKSYDLLETLRQLKPCVCSDTTFISLLNGVNHVSRIKDVYPLNNVINGCAYIVSSIQEPGHIKNVGNIQRLSFGKINTTNFDLEAIMKAAEIDVIYGDNIETIVWEKFIFLSPLATISSYYQKSIGEILSNKKIKNELIELLKEIFTLAKTKQVLLPNDLIERTIEKYTNLPFETTTSLQRDFIKNPQKTEYDSLTGSVIRECDVMNLSCQRYLKCYQKLNNVC